MRIKMLWEIFKSILGYAFLVYAILFIVVGGEFHISITWSNVIDFLKTIVK